MDVRFWGTRGSMAKPGPTTLRYGGNTPCVEIRGVDDTLVVLDCGTGAHGLGQSLLAAGAVTLGWRDMLIAQAEELRKSGKSMILLWMDGGPSQYETFNPKIGSKYQGPARAISTKLPGVQFADFWPRTAQAMDKIALIRSMTSREAEHDRAITLVRTGYPPNPSVRYPTFGSIVARERGPRSTT